ncbi:hypothetical protein [Moraxella nonliquefaciens]|jgi:hypothetical protein|nr:hypothetical protein [Moraxella nonliquefaciens]
MTAIIMFDLTRSNNRSLAQIRHENLIYYTLNFDKFTQIFDKY